MALRIMTIYGTRPEAIKVAPVIKAIEKQPGLESIVVVTGQHREMLDQVNELFQIVPDHDMNIMSAGQSLNMIVAKVIGGIDSILDLESPDAVIVQGDTSTVMGAAIAAFNRGIPVVHVEAGLRSGDISSPFPEEGNRKLTSQIAALHLAPTDTSRSNLLRDGVDGDDIVVTGNTVIDALMETAGRNVEFTDPRLRALEGPRVGGSDEKVVLVTTHRRENLEAMQGIGAAVADLARKYPTMTVVLPIHRNPVVREAVLPSLEGLNNVIVTEPLTYVEFARALTLSDIVLTDSGGVQEEAPSLGKPVLVMRENTERPEAVVAGTVKLIGTHRERIVDEVSLLVDSVESYRAMANAVNPYGDGHAAERTVEAILWRFAGGERPAQFQVEGAFA